MQDLGDDALVQSVPQKSRYQDRLGTSATISTIHHPAFMILVRRDNFQFYLFHIPTRFPSMTTISVSRLTVDGR